MGRGCNDNRLLILLLDVIELVIIGYDWIQS